MKKLLLLILFLFPLNGFTNPYPADENNPYEFWGYTSYKEYDSKPVTCEEAGKFIDIAEGQQDPRNPIGRHYIYKIFLGFTGESRNFIGIPKDKLCDYNWKFVREYATKDTNFYVGRLYVQYNGNQELYGQYMIDPTTIKEEEKIKRLKEEEIQRNSAMYQNIDREELRKAEEEAKKIIEQKKSSIVMEEKKVLVENELKITKKLSPVNERKAVLLKKRIQLLKKQLEILEKQLKSL